MSLNTVNYLAVVKLAYVPLTDSDQEAVPGNIGAARFGLEALQKEDAADPRAATLWKQAEDELATESNNDTGAGASGNINIPDDYDMAGMDC